MGIFPFTPHDVGVSETLHVWKLRLLCQYNIYQPGLSTVKTGRLFLLKKMDNARDETYDTTDRCEKLDMNNYYIYTAAEKKLKHVSSKWYAQPRWKI